MRHIILSIAAVPILGLGACNSNAPANTTMTRMDDGSLSNAAMRDREPAVLSSQEYVRQAAMGDMYEIEAARIALDKSHTTEVRDFAQRMIRDHSDATEKIKAALGRSGLAIMPPATLDPEHQAKLDALRDDTGDAFDRGYLDQQVAAHEMALQLHRTYAAKGDNAELKAVADAIAPTVSGHLDTLGRITENDAAQ